LSFGWSGCLHKHPDHSFFFPAIETRPANSGIPVCQARLLRRSPRIVTGSKQTIHVLPILRISALSERVPSRCYALAPDTIQDKVRYHLASILALRFLDNQSLIEGLTVAQLHLWVTEPCQAVHLQAQARSSRLCVKGPSLLQSVR